MELPHHFLERLERKVDLLNLISQAIERKVDKLMATLSQDYLALAAQIDQATNRVAEKIAALAAGIHNSMTDQEVADTKAAFQAEVDRLTALGANPDNPVP